MHRPVNSHSVRRARLLAEYGNQNDIDMTIGQWAFGWTKSRVNTGATLLIFDLLPATETGTFPLIQRYSPLSTPNGHFKQLSHEPFGFPQPIDPSHATGGE